MKRRPPTEPPTATQSSAVGTSGRGSSLGVLFCAIVVFGIILVVPQAGRALGVVLLGGAVVLPGWFLLLSLRNRTDPALAPGICIVLALGIVGAVINSAVRRGPDWRLGVFLLAAMLWLVVAGIGWSKSR